MEQRGWLVAHGGEWNDLLAVSAFERSRGLFATGDISEGALLLSVPAAVLLTARIADEWQWPASLQEADKIALVLMIEVEKLETSKWHPWTASIPKEFNLPFTWEASSGGDGGGSRSSSARVEITELRSPELTARVTAQQADAKERFEAIRALTHGLDPQHQLRLLFERSRGDDDSVWRRYLWALSALESRGKYLEDEALHAERWAVVPAGDGFNHASAEDANVDAAFDRGRRAFVYRTARAVSRGEELLLCYGPHDDSTLVQSYGFVLPDNPHARVLLPPRRVEGDHEQVETRKAHEESCDQLEARPTVGSSAGAAHGGGTAGWLSAADMAWLEENGLSEAEHALHPFGPSWSLLGALRLLHASPTERAGGAAFAIVEGEPVSSRCECLVWSHARQMAEELLRGRFADLESLEDELEAARKPRPRGSVPDGGSASKRERRLLTLQWLVSQGNVVKAALEAIAAQQAELNAEEEEEDQRRHEGAEGDEDVQHAEFESRQQKKQRV